MWSLLVEDSDLTSLLKAANVYQLKDLSLISDGLVILIWLFAIKITILQTLFRQSW
jgi:hypothetical protein